MKKRISIVSALALATALAFAAAAQATTLGTTTQPAGSTPSGCGANGVVNQLTSDPSMPYSVPGPGTITQWQTETGSGPDTPGLPVELVVLRPTSAGYHVIAVDVRTIPDPLPAGNIATFPLSTPIGVQAGDTFGLYTNIELGVICFWHSGSTPAADSLGALPAPSTPAPGQNLSVGDESGGGFTLDLAATFVPASTPAPTPTPTPTPRKKKCKKHKKHKRSASSAKKKCKKKKKR